MGRRPEGPAGERHGPDIRALEMLLDYAMIEGAELRLPRFVLLLRSARLELENRMAAPNALRRRRRKAKIGQCQDSAVAEPGLERWIAPASDVLNGPVSVNETR